MPEARVRSDETCARYWRKLCTQNLLIHPYLPRSKTESRHIRLRDDPTVSDMKIENIQQKPQNASDDLEEENKRGIHQESTVQKKRLS